MDETDGHFIVVIHVAVILKGAESQITDRDNSKMIEVAFRQASVLVTDNVQYCLDI